MDYIFNPFEPFSRQAFYLGLWGIALLLVLGVLLLMMQYSHIYCKNFHVLSAGLISTVFSGVFMTIFYPFVAFALTVVIACLVAWILRKDEFILIQQERRGIWAVSERKSRRQHTKWMRMSIDEQAKIMETYDARYHNRFNPILFVVIQVVCALVYYIVLLWDSAYNA